MITAAAVPVPLPRQRVAADQRPLTPTLPSPWEVEHERHGEHDDQPTRHQPARFGGSVSDRSRRQCVTRAPPPASHRLNETLEAARR